ncbi:MAG: SGNH/GDSL hydrolase family protein [Byssovorax sp.]
MPKRLRALLLKSLLAMACSLAVVAGAEAALRLSNPKRAPGTVPLVSFCGDCPKVFGLNPKRPQVSPQGLRDRAYTPHPADDVHRILVLGDSLAYGIGVQVDQTFPKQLEKVLHEGPGSFEVINSGVPGYTPYSELQYYLHEGRKLHPELVVISFCMNDVANPALHWAGFASTRAMESLPAEAIPNPAYHEAHVLPQIHRQRQELRSRAQQGPLRSLVQGTELYKRWHRLSTRPRRTVEHEGKDVPVFLVGEDSISIEVLTDPQSAEWRWVRSIYDQIIRAARADGADVAIVVNPLAYQLDESYPFLPQTHFAAYCEERSLPCLDLLPALREKKAEKPFFGQVEDREDIWHYSPAGHRMVAEEIAAFLRRERLTGVPGETPLRTPRLPPVE